MLRIIYVLGISWRDQTEEKSFARNGVYVIKRNEDGRATWCKAWLVAKSFSQVPVANFHDEYAPVTMYATVRTMIALSTLGVWRRRLMVFKNTFFNADLTEETYVEQPQPFVLYCKENFLYILPKSLYGLRQASPDCNCQTHNFLTAFSCEQSLADPTMYPWEGSGRFVLLIDYVDDIQMSGSTREAIDVLVEHFRAWFEVRVDDSVTKFLGLSVEDRGNRVMLQNVPMVQRLLELFKMDQCKQSKTLLPLGLDLSSDISETLEDVTPYRQLTFAPMHIANTARPDVSYANGYLSRLVHTPTDQLRKAAKHVHR